MNATDLELTILEDLLNEECKCEAKMHPIPCSIKVVARLTYSCGGHFPLVCRSTILDVLDSVMAGDTCAECGQYIRNYWRVTPV